MLILLTGIFLFKCLIGLLECIDNSKNVIILKTKTTTEAVQDGWMQDFEGMD